MELQPEEVLILQSLDDDYKWIVRDEKGFLYVYKTKPQKDKYGFWYCTEFPKEILFVWSMLPFTYLFKMVNYTDEKPTVIRDLLKGE